jgi:hypothetical protein
MFSAWEKLKTHGVSSEKSSKLRRKVVKNRIQNPRLPLEGAGRRKL